MRELKEPVRIMVIVAVVLFSLWAVLGCATTKELAALQERVNQVAEKADLAMEEAKRAKLMAVSESEKSEAAAIRSEAAAGQARSEADRAEAMAKKTEAIFMKKMKK
ncbi:MAG: hypothetical protein JRD04_01080 [Deltaproteobacteria bacterium]|nr:hypothetical protein [Deltaproteobacteria bacterium]